MQAPVELTVSGKTLRGMLHRPDDVARGPMAVIYHGFTGNRIEPHFIMVKLSRALAKAGIASVRFDFSGSGESDGEFEDMTLSGEVAEAKAILDYARGLPCADPARTFLVGLSMGGAIASIVAGDEGGKVRGIALWAPAGTIADLIVNHLTPEQEETLRREGRADYRGLWVGRGFMEDLKGWDVFGRAARYPGRVLLLHGDGDEAVPLDVSKRYKDIYGDRAELHIIPGADHTFNRCDWEEEVLRRTVAFLCEECGETQWP